MAENSKIEWTNRTWNVVVGCTKVSPGCKHCYAIREAHRMEGNPNPKISSVYEGTTDAHGRNWTGKVKFVVERLHDPVSWKKPAMVFVNSMSDLFHEDLPFSVIAQIFETMRLAHWHTFQVLTKRPERMYAFWQWVQVSRIGLAEYWPLPNVWLGTSVENQEYADERIPELLNAPAVVHFLSCEPLLGPIDLDLCGKHYGRDALNEMVNWVICGGESGHNARPMHPDWARSLRDQCQAANIPFLFKQWGMWLPVSQSGDGWGNIPMGSKEDYFFNMPYAKVGKHAAGRLLDGRAWDEFPKPMVMP